RGASEGATCEGHDEIRTSMARRSNSRQRLQGRFRFGGASSFPIVAYATVCDVREVGVLVREQPALLGFCLRPRSGELSERRCLSVCPERHRDHPGDGAVLEPARGQVAKQSHDSFVFLGVPAVVETVARSKPRWWFLLSYDSLGDARRLTDIACCQ